MRRICLLLIILTMNGMSMNEARSSQQSSPEELRKQGNHLRDEPSLYLQQHAYNPIDWYPWGPEALDKAKDEDKPIFLSIGYSSCHWCHVMEHETFEKDDVAQFMNTHFVCIKVDREERPDLDAVYMEAVQMLTGRGGWPMSVFLTPDLKPFYGGTYFPKETFLNLTDQIVTAYSAQRGSLEEQAEKLTTQIQRTSEAILGEGEGLTGQMIEQAVEKAQQGYDAQNGGFRQGQKFPTPVKWRFLLHEYRFAGDKELGRMIIHSLEAMARGGLYDHVGGGFHRYTVDENWTVPHFEKMLYDNGQMASLMLEAGAVFARPDFTATGLDVLDFLLREMKDEQGGIYASFDADSGGEEGSYYVWNRADISAVVGMDDGSALADVLGVTPEGNFEHTGKSVLTRRADLSELGKKHQSTESALTDLFAKHRLALRKQRDHRTAPGLDRKIVTSWNGLVLTALAQGYAVSGNATYLKAAQKTANFLLKEHRRQDGSLWRTSSDGRLSGEGILDDYAFLADGLLELYQVSGDSKYLAAAKELVDFTLNHFDNPEGTFYLSRAEVKAPLGRRVEYFDSVEPAGASAMMNNLIKLSALTGETRYLDRAKKDLDRVSSLLDRAGPEMAWWFDAARKLTAPYYDVVIAGDNGQGIAMLQALISRLPSSAVVSIVPANGAPAGQTQLAPALVGKTAVSEKSTAFVCKFGTCNAPTTEIDEMLKQSLGGWKH